MFSKYNVNNAHFVSLVFVVIIYILKNIRSQTTHKGSEQTLKALWHSFPFVDVDNE